MSDEEEFSTEDLDFGESMGAEAARTAKGASTGTFRRYGYFGLKDGDVINVRFLSDVVAAESNPVQWITALQHNFVQTKPAPKVNGEDQKGWPKGLTAICRHDKIFKTRYKDCYICDEMRKDGKKINATAKTWALAVRREEVWEDGKMQGLRDATKELVLVDDEGTATGETEEVKDILIVNMSYKNFFSIIQGMSGLWGTVLDRDLQIKRSGSGMNDTEYAVAAHDPIEWKPGIRYDLRIPEIMTERFPTLPDLRRIVAEKASDKFYKTYFIPESGRSGPATPSTEPTSEQAKGLAARVLGYKEKAEAASSGGGRAL